MGGMISFECISGGSANGWEPAFIQKYWRFGVIVIK